MQDKVFLDTNILVYLSNEDSEFHTGVLNVLKVFAAIRRHFELWISRQVLREYAVIVSRPGLMETPTDTATLVSALLKWVSLFSVADETEDVTRNLIGLITAYDIKGKRIHDANIVAAMMTYRIPNLLTMNADDFKSFNEIKLMELDL